MNKFREFFLLSFCAVGLLHATCNSSHAQYTQGTWGFDAIGNNTAALDGAECKQSILTHTSTGYKRFMSMWTPPANYSQYTMNQFRAVTGMMPDAIQGVSGNPATSQDVRLFVYDNFDRYIQNPNENWRARYSFTRPFTSAVTFQSAGFSGQSCGNFSCITNVPLYYMTLNLKQPSQVLYRDSNGNSTTSVLRLIGGRRYYFSLVGDGWTSATGYPCTVRTKSTQTGYMSPPPNPALSFAMTPTQCSGAGMPSGCSFDMAHSELYSVSSDNANLNLTPVQWTNTVSPWGPFWNTAGGPMGCAWGTSSLPCEKRTLPGRTAYALSVTPYAKLSIPYHLTPVDRFTVASCERYGC